jgi:hypothetical protein
MPVTAIYAQITREQADETVSKYLKNELTEYYWLYANNNLDSDKGNTTIPVCSKEVLNVDYSSFVYFVDEYPYANWAHPCRYLFISKKDGKVEVKKRKYPPEYLETWEMLTSIPEDMETVKYDFSKNLQEVPSNILRSGINPLNCYAVIISGGMNMSNNWQRYWNDCSTIYSALVNVYGYLDDHIYILMSDGTDPANDRRIASGYDSSPLDLDGDGDADVQYAATRNNITTVFNTLSNNLTESDYLFIYTTDHGDMSSGGQAYLLLWAGDVIYDYEFANEVNKVNAGNISIVMEQCYSGGFVSDLAKLGRTVATACAENELSYGMGAYTYDAFVYYWTAAVAGHYPSGTPVNADYNNDGYVSMQEAFDYANIHDTMSETPQYNSVKNQLGEYLTLLGTQACTTTNVVSQTVGANTSVIGCNIYVQNVTVTNGATLTLDAAGETILSNVEVQLGSQLDIK